MNKLSEIPLQTPVRESQPKIIPKTLFSESTSTPIFDIKKRKDNRRFKLFVRQKGKFQARDIGYNVEELSQTGQDILKNTLRASFKITSESGDTVNVSVPTGFTRSKRESNVIVQPRTFRLSSLGEKAEISQSRKKRRFF